MKRTILVNDKITVVAVSDLHINFTGGLCPPSVPLDDGGTYLPSKPQRVLERRICASTGAAQMTRLLYELDNWLFYLMRWVRGER
jgi:hypothetical protein